MLQGEHSAILSTLIKLQFVIKFFVLSIFEWPFYTGFTIIRSFMGVNHLLFLSGFCYNHLCYFYVVFVMLSCASAY